MPKTVGIIVLVVVFSIIFVGPVRNYLNNLFHRDKSGATEEQMVGTVSGYNPRVEEIQRILKEADFDPGPVDGMMGAQTRRAIREFQKTKGLTPTAKIDSKTYLALNREKEVLVEQKKKEEQKQILFSKQMRDERKAVTRENMLKTTGPQNKTMKEGLPGDRIKQIQIALQKAGFYKGKIDGKIGPQTRRAVISFQKSKGLKPDGIIGVKTWDELSKYLKN